MFFLLLARSKVNIINLHSVDIREWLKDPANLYIGRETDQIAASEWGNPYRINKVHNRDQVIALYGRYITKNTKLLDSVGDLRGKVLGCWCSPQSCHAEVLHRLAGNDPVYASE